MKRNNELINVSKSAESFSSYDIHGFKFYVVKKKEEWKTITTTLQLQLQLHYNYNTTITIIFIN